MPAGYSQPLYILPFDRRASFVSGLFGWTGTLKPEQTAQVTAFKRVIYDGFTAAVADGVDKAKAGVLVDEHFGADILRDAKRSSVITCAPPRRAGWTTSSSTSSSSSATTSRATSRPSRRPFARCWCATTRKAMQQ